MHIATSLQLPSGRGDLAGAGDGIGAWTPVTSQIWFVPFFKTQFDLPRAHLSEFNLPCATIILNPFVVRKTREFECSID
jgi:hypothetical protein